MKVLKPEYYDKFKCIAGECQESCCIGWKVAIDKKTYNKYKRVKGSFGKELNEGISRDRSNEDKLNYGKMKLDGEKRCTFLNINNLCEVYINIGEDYLCNTCKIYPRTMNKYGDILERNLTLSCPEVARTLVEMSEKFSFSFKEEKLNQLDFDNINEEVKKDSVYNLFWKARAFFIEIAQFREIELWKRLSLIKLCQEKIQDVIKQGNYNKIDNIINTLCVSITDEEIIKSLDNINSANEVKNLFINSIISLRGEFNISSNIFIGIVSNLKELIENNLDDESKIMSEIEREFNEYFRNKEYILENFVVYNLYKNCMLGIKNRDLNEAIITTITEYAFLKKLLVIKWNSNGKKMEKQDIVDVIYSFSRTVEHNPKYMKKLCNNIKVAGYDSLAYLTILVR